MNEAQIKEKTAKLAFWTEGIKLTTAIFLLITAFVASNWISYLIGLSK